MAERLVFTYIERNVVDTRSRPTGADVPTNLAVLCNCR